MAIVSVMEKFMLIVAVCIAALVPGALSTLSETNIPGLSPLKPGEEQIRNCLSVITKVPGCISEIYASIQTDKVVIISSACCSAINEVRHSNCNPRIFPPTPTTPTIPPVSRKSCPAIAEMFVRNEGETDIPALLPPIIGSETAKCWSNLTGIVGCVSDVFKAMTSGQFSKIGGDCCNAIENIEDSCWFVMFPLQPSFPELLKGFCAFASQQSGAILN